MQRIFGYERLSFRSIPHQAILHPASPSRHPAPRSKLPRSALNLPRHPHKLLPRGCGQSSFCNGVLHLIACRHSCCRQLKLCIVFRNVGAEGEKILKTVKLLHVHDKEGFVVTNMDETYHFIHGGFGDAKITKIPELKTTVRQVRGGKGARRFNGGGDVYHWGTIGGIAILAPKLMHKEEWSFEIDKDFWKVISVGRSFGANFVLTDRGKEC
ncbi:hypothetical protein Fcan01_19453 [Folsomia candida]|uniref:Uncharacterized protein n=1 Tax=Folsomia candida TaxID=158441 RepID=A0A226DNB1_FOLCA|nr:hypothetical protein Fcan01_19453 [Folsomia candida]